jgi:WD40 repeat protein
MRTYYLGAPATAVARNDHYLASGTSTGVICLRRIRDDALLQCVHAHSKTVASLETHGRQLLSCGWDGSVVIWEIPTLRIAKRTTISGSANDCAFSPDGTIVAIAASKEPPIRSPEAVAKERQGFPAVDPSSPVLLWHINEKRFGRLHGHQAAVTSVAWTGGNQLLSASWDRTVRRWQLGRQDSIILHRFGNLVRRVAADESGRVAAAAGWAGKPGDSATVLLHLLYRSN